MKGFDPKFKDFNDYILCLTNEIWEDLGISLSINHESISCLVIVGRKGCVSDASKT